MEGHAPEHAKSPNSCWPAPSTNGFFGPRIANKRPQPGWRGDIRDTSVGLAPSPNGCFRDGTVNKRSQAAWRGCIPHASTRPGTVSKRPFQGCDRQQTGRRGDIPNTSVRPAPSPNGLSGMPPSTNGSQPGCGGAGYLSGVAGTCAFHRVTKTGYCPSSPVRKRASRRVWISRMRR
jgi:hypothetical protein